MPDRPRLPRYPVYIPSKGRPGRRALTARFLAADGVPFRLVVEPRERDAYAADFGPDAVLTLPRDDNGSSIPARNWIKAHATAAGFARHWQLDDNLRMVRRMWNGRRIRCAAGPALAVVEDFADRYANVAVAGLNYTMFLPSSARQIYPPFYVNIRVYSCALVRNDLPFGWRGRYNEDTDFCLQALARGECTVLVNAFMVDKVWTMAMKGGNTDTLYAGDGRLRMARALERLWPGVVAVDRRFRRPQHVVADQWRRFDIPLVPAPGFDPAALPPTDDYGLTLVARIPPRAPALRALVAAPDGPAGIADAAAGECAR